MTEIVAAQESGKVTRIAECTYQSNGIAVTISSSGGEHMYFVDKTCVTLHQFVKEGEPIGEYDTVT